MACRLRIAAAVFFALLAIALISLWVRSYKTADVPCYASSASVALRILSHRGIVTIALFNPEQLWNHRGWHLDHFPADIQGDLWESSFWGFRFRQDSRFSCCSIPYYFLPALSLALAALFAFKRNWRFTTRGLLIATTIVAAILGLAVYAI